MEKIGYIESNKNQNLFYKQISDNEEKGVVLADLRGIEIVRFWKPTTLIGVMEKK